MKKITEEDIDTAISRTLTHFIALGELDGPSTTRGYTRGGNKDDAAHH